MTETGEGKIPSPQNKVWTLDDRIHVKTHKGQKIVISNSKDINKFKRQY